MTTQPDMAMSEEPSNYMKYRGKCKQFVDALCAEDSTLTSVRGHYFEPAWGEPQPHWWCVKPDGTIVDPTKLQFPSEGRSIYIPFDGHVECDNCGKEGREEDFDTSHGRYVFCGYECGVKFCL